MEIDNRSIDTRNDCLNTKNAKKGKAIIRFLKNPFAFFRLILR